MTQVVGTYVIANVTFLKTYENATKLFQLGDSLGIATWGAGNIGPRSIGGIILDYAENTPQLSSTVEEVAKELAQFIEQVYNTAFSTVEVNRRPLLGFLVGGYSSKQPLAELWEIRFPFIDPSGEQVRLVRGQEDFGANWRGIEIPF